MSTSRRGRPGEPATSDLTVLPVVPSRWPDFKHLFEARGGPKTCWCMHFRRDQAGRTPRAKHNRKRAMETRIRSGIPSGLLAYDRSGEAVAWCSVAPRATLVLHGGVDLPGEDPAEVWSITCFYVKSGIRGRGIMERLIEEAADHARRNGGTSLEAYPVVPDSPSYRFCGFTPVFERHGFVEVGRAGLRRRVMRRALL